MEARSGWRSPGPILERAQTAVPGRAGRAEARLLVEPSELPQQLLDEVLRTGQES